MDDIKNFRHFGRKILCVGRNYKALAAEQGNPIPDKPIVFLKPTTSYIGPGESIKIPLDCEEFFHEVELGVVIGQTTRNVNQTDAMNHVAGYALCLDMTAMDFQRKAKKAGQPWSVAKGFDTGCPVGQFIPKDKIKDTSDIRLWLNIDGDIKQDSMTSDMIFSVPHVLSYLSQYFTQERGDLVLTGSPAGAGPVTRGQVIEAALEVHGETLDTYKCKIV